MKCSKVIICMKNIKIDFFVFIKIWFSLRLYEKKMVRILLFYCGCYVCNIKISLDKQKPGEKCLFDKLISFLPILSFPVDHNNPPMD